MGGSAHAIGSDLGQYNPVVRTVSGRRGSGRACRIRHGVDGDTDDLFTAVAAERSLLTRPDPAVHNRHDHGDGQRHVGVSGQRFPQSLQSRAVLSHYDLYNTVTTGTVTTNPSGSYDISYSLLFELKLTSGPLAGLIFETLQDATFAASDIPTLPFPAGTAFSDPAGPANDGIYIYVKYDPTGTYAPGTLAGESFDRVVTVNSIVPEPSSIVSGSLAAVICVFCGWRRSRVSRVRSGD